MAMAELKLSPFRRNRELKSQIDEMLDVVSQAALAYKDGVSQYIRRGWDTSVEDKCNQVSSCESRGDKLRSVIGQSMYSEMLLPDTSGDVLGLLSSLDQLLDDLERNLQMLQIERPEIPTEYHEDWTECVGAAADAIEAVVLAARHYFRDPKAARDHIHKIHYYEKSTQTIAMRLIERIFKSDLPLDRKMLLRGHVWLVDRLADKADDAGDALAIYAVKRSV
jgi:predicted phosphate transport protein (TIGR00153 family)